MIAKINLYKINKIVSSVQLLFLREAKKGEVWNKTKLKIIFVPPLGNCPWSVLPILDFDYQFKPIFMTPYFNWFHYIRAIGGNFIIQFFSLPIVTIRYILSQNQQHKVTNNRPSISSFVDVIATSTLLYCIMWFKIFLTLF